MNDQQLHGFIGRKISKGAPMHRIISAVVLFGGSFLLRMMLFGDPAPDAAAGGAVKMTSTTGARNDMIFYLAKALGVGDLPQNEMTVLTAIGTVYCFVLGVITDLILGERGFGKGFNGFIAFIGAFFALMIYSTIFGQFHKEHISTLILVVTAASTGVLLLAAFLKHWVIDSAEDYMSSAVEKPRAPKRRGGASAADRFNNIANR